MGAITSAYKMTVLITFKEIKERRGLPPPPMTVFSVHRQQPSRGQHARQLWDPDDRDISRSPQLLSFIRGTWAGDGQGNPRWD